MWFILIQKPPGLFLAVAVQFTADSQQIIPVVTSSLESQALLHRGLQN